MTDFKITSALKSKPSACRRSVLLSAVSRLTLSAVGAMAVQGAAMAADIEWRGGWNGDVGSPGGGIGGNQNWSNGDVAGQNDAVTISKQYTVGGQNPPPAPNANATPNAYGQSWGALSGDGDMTIVLGSGRFLKVGFLGGATTYSGGIGDRNEGTIAPAKFYIVNPTAGGSLPTILTLSGDNTYSSDTYIEAEVKAGKAYALSRNSAIFMSNDIRSKLDIAGYDQTIKALNGGGASGGNVTLGVANLEILNGGNYDGSISGAGGVKLSGGSLALTGTQTYSGATIVANGATLNNKGDKMGVGATSNFGAFINEAGASWSGAMTSSGTFTNNGVWNGAVTITGGTLSGVGKIVGATRIDSGFLKPGDGTPDQSMKVEGSLTFLSPATYAVVLDPTTSSFVTVTGNAALAGKVQATFKPGTYVTKTYTILKAASVSGKFDSLEAQGNPAGFKYFLSYTDKEAQLSLLSQLAQLSSSDLNLAQRRVGAAIDTYFNNGGPLPASFLPLYSLVGQARGAALSQLTGEAATGAQSSAFGLMGGFLNMLGDSASMSRVGARVPGASGWSVWAEVFGAGDHVSGDSLSGTHALTDRSGGLAAGADYRVSEDTLLGFSLAGAGTSWSTQGLGNGSTNAFMAGLYGRQQLGAAYVSGSFGFANHWMSTERTALGGTQITADMKGQSWAGRLETGYKLTTTYGAWSPYAALQAQSFHTPAYKEFDRAWGDFSLSFASQTSDSTRGELGLRFEHAFKLDGGQAWKFRARAGWAHDWTSAPSLTATFQSLPGASFVTSGAKRAPNIALLSAGVETEVVKNVTLGAKLDGQWGRAAMGYGGTAVLSLAF